MKKSNYYAKTGAIVFGIGNGMINVIRQLNSMNSDPNLAFNWDNFLTAMGKGAVFGASGGYVIGWFRDLKNSRIKPIDLDDHLNVQVENILLNKDDPEYIELKNVVSGIISEFELEFSGLLQSKLIPFGSSEKGTALNDSFDLDYAIKFKPTSFPCSEIMYEEVFSFFNERVGDLNIVDIRKQKRSIGVFLKMNEQEYKVDFAPYKLTKEGDQSGYLFVNKKGILIDNSTIQKTDIRKLTSTKLSATQKKLVLLLKDWKNKNELPLPSHLLEYLVLDAYKRNKGKLPGKVSDKLILVLKHIAENLNCICIRGNENSNNVLTNKIAKDEKRVIMDACKDAIKKIEYQPNAMVDIFS